MMTSDYGEKTMPRSSLSLGASLPVLAACLLSTTVMSMPAFAEDSVQRTSQDAQPLPLCRNAEPGQRCRTRNGEIRTRSETRPQGNRTERRARRASEATNGATFTRPEVDDEVVVEFEHGDLQRPVIIGRGGQEVQTDQPPANGFVEDRTYDSEISVGDELPSGVQQQRSATLPHADGIRRPDRDGMDAEETDEFGGEDIGFARQRFGGQDLGGRTAGDAPEPTNMESEFTDEEGDGPQEPQVPTGGGTTTTTPSDPDPDPEDCEYRNPAGGPDQEFCDE
jgi:hypothetical protein